MLYKRRSRNRDTFTIIRDDQEQTFSTPTSFIIRYRDWQAREILGHLPGMSPQLSLNPLFSTLLAQRGFIAIYGWALEPVPISGWPTILPERTTSPEKWALLHHGIALRC